MQKKFLSLIVLVLMVLCSFMISCERDKNIPPHGAEYGCVCSYTEFGYTNSRDYTAFELNEMGLLNCLSLQQALQHQGKSKVSCHEK